MPRLCQISNNEGFYLSREHTQEYLEVNVSSSSLVFIDKIRTVIGKSAKNPSRPFLWEIITFIRLAFVAALTTLTHIGRLSRAVGMHDHARNFTSGEFINC